jgi:hypothetical protein
LPAITGEWQARQSSGICCFAIVFGGLHNDTDKNAAAGNSTSANQTGSGRETASHDTGSRGTGHSRGYVIAAGNPHNRTIRLSGA